MVWIIVFGAIALAGVAMAISYGVWLLHKASDVMSEVRVLAERGEALADLLGQVAVPAPGGAGASGRDIAGEVFADRDDVR